MSSDSRKTRPDQTDLFGGEAAPKGYVPDPRHVRNRLDDLVSTMRASATWPWGPAVVGLHRQRTFTYLCDLLPDREEAEEWRRRIDAEVARLDGAEAA